MEYSGHVGYKLVCSSVVLSVVEYLKTYIYLYIDIVIEPHNIPVESVIQSNASCKTSIDLEEDENSLGKNSVKWSDPVHFLKSQGKLFLSFPCTFFSHIFDA